MIHFFHDVFKYDMKEVYLHECMERLGLYPRVCCSGLFSGPVFPHHRWARIRDSAGDGLRLCPAAAVLEEGIAYTGKKVLQYSIILLGFEMNLYHVLDTGAKSVSVMVCTLATAFLVAIVVGKLLHLEFKTRPSSAPARPSAAVRLSPPWRRSSKPRKKTWPFPFRRFSCSTSLPSLSFPFWATSWA